MSKETTESILNDLSASQNQDEKDFACALRTYIDSGEQMDVTPLPKISSWTDSSLARCATQEFSQTAQRIAEYLLLLIKLGHPTNNRLAERFFYWIVNNSEKQRTLIQTIDYLDLDHMIFASYIIQNHSSYLQFGWLGRIKGSEQGPAPSPADTSAFTPIEQLIWNLPDNQIVELLGQHTIAPLRYGKIKNWHAHCLQGTLSIFRPKPLSTFLKSINTREDADKSVGWNYILTASEAFDSECIRYSNLCTTGESLETLFFSRSNQKWKIPGSCLGRHQQKRALLY